MTAITFAAFTSRVVQSAQSYDDHLVTVNALGAEVSWLPVLLLIGWASHLAAARGSKAP